MLSLIGKLLKLKISKLSKRKTTFLWLPSVQWYQLRVKFFLRFFLTKFMIKLFYRSTKTIETKSNSGCCIGTVHFRKVKPEQPKSSNIFACLLVLCFQICKYRLFVRISTTSRRFRRYCQLSSSWFNKHRNLEEGATSVFLGTDHFAKSILQNAWTRCANNDTSCSVQRSRWDFWQIFLRLSCKQKLLSFYYRSFYFSEMQWNFRYSY